MRFSSAASMTFPFVGCGVPVSDGGAVPGRWRAGWLPARPRPPFLSAWRPLTQAAEPEARGSLGRGRVRERAKHRSGSPRNPPYWREIFIMIYLGLVGAMGDRRPGAGSDLGQRGDSQDHMISRRPTLQFAYRNP